MDPIPGVQRSVGPIPAAGVSPGDPAVAPRATLKEAAEGFEAILLSYMLKGLGQTIPHMGAKGTPFARQFYDDLLNHYLATHLAKSGGIGLSEVILRSLPGGSGHPRAEK
jgi:Rod binding domain-containing protein